VSFEAAHSADRLRIFKSAAHYALTLAELEEILDHDEVEVESYIRGIVTAGIRLWKYEAPEEVIYLFY
jgi:antitoxin component HigA of HigAB toxin-antitoxin module